jgi:hypothetical protein
MDKNSLVCQLESPQYLLFQEVFTFSCSIFCGLTPIAKEMLSKEVMGSSYNFFERALDQNFSQHTITDISQSVLYNCFGKNNNLLSVIEKLTNSSIDIQVEPQIKITITSNKEDIIHATKFITERIEV